MQLKHGFWQQIAFHSQVSVIFKKCVFKPLCTSSLEVCFIDHRFCFSFVPVHTVDVKRWNTLREGRERMHGRFSHETVFENLKWCITKWCITSIQYASNFRNAEHSVQTLCTFNIFCSAILFRYWNFRNATWVTCVWRIIPFCFNDKSNFKVSLGAHCMLKRTHIFWNFIVILGVRSTSSTHDVQSGVLCRRCDLSQTFQNLSSWPSSWQLNEPGNVCNFGIHLFCCMATAVWPSLALHGLPDELLACINSLWPWPVLCFIY